MRLNSRACLGPPTLAAINPLCVLAVRELGSDKLQPLASAPAPEEALKFLGQLKTCNTCQDLPGIHDSVRIQDGQRHRMVSREAPVAAIQEGLLAQTSRTGCLPVKGTRAVSLPGRKQLYSVHIRRYQTSCPKISCDLCVQVGTPKCWQSRRCAEIQAPEGGCRHGILEREDEHSSRRLGSLNQPHAIVNSSRCPGNVPTTAAQDVKTWLHMV